MNYFNDLVNKTKKQWTEAMSKNDTSTTIV